MINHKQLRTIYINYFKRLNHYEIPAAPLVLNDDATTLFTSSGMQPLVSYLLGNSHPLGKRLVDIQPCFRAVDINQVGDSKHTTFFEMMGNWSLGDYYKQQQLEWYLIFLIKELGIDIKRLYFTVFEGVLGVKHDYESSEILVKLGINKNRIIKYGTADNWWSRSGPPDKMPAGEIGGPSCEVFYDFGEELGLHQKSKFKSKKCHPNCNCGRFIEIGNSVFLEYLKDKSGKLVLLKQKNVDFGGGLERTLAAIENKADIFTTDLFLSIIKQIEIATKIKYHNRQPEMQTIADHLKASVMMITGGVMPSNKTQGYLLRRLLRRAALKLYQLNDKLKFDFGSIIDQGIMLIYNGIYGIDAENQKQTVTKIINDEMLRFSESLDKGLKYYKKLADPDINGLSAFNLFQNYGFPFEITQELALQKGIFINRKEFDDAYAKHRQLSKNISSGMFKSGLLDESEQVIKYHTATHLLHQALRKILGMQVSQNGSNITSERLRFDFNYSGLFNDQQIKQIEDDINLQINRALPVKFIILPKKEAYQVGALSFFREKYPDKVKVYYIGDSLDKAYSKEFCGGPHVENTGEIGQIKIIKFKKIGSDLFRIYLK